MCRKSWKLAEVCQVQSFEFQKKKEKALRQILWRARHLVPEDWSHEDHIFYSHFFCLLFFSVFIYKSWFFFEYLFLFFGNRQHGGLLFSGSLSKCCINHGWGMWSQVLGTQARPPLWWQGLRSWCHCQERLSDLALRQRGHKQHGPCPTALPGALGS